MAELKTQKNDTSVSNFIEALDDETKKSDSHALVKIFTELTGQDPVMWGTSIIGFGEYHYKSDRSTQEGDWPRTGFSPRKANISIYIMPGINNYESLLDKLGKYKASKGSCLYIKRLSDVDTTVLKKIIAQSLKDMEKLYPSK